MSLAPPTIARPAGAHLVHSGYVVSSLAQAVADCVHNSLGAGATEVHVEVDAAAFGFKVADDGSGIAADVLVGLPARSTAPGRSGPLAALCDSAVVELTSRAAGSFETYTKVLCGGTAAKYGLALEQRSRQGTIVQVKDLWHNVPVRRKALVSAGLQKEVERCREAAFRLALVRPGVTFTLFDRGRKAFLLRLLKGRSMQQDVAEAFGQPAGGTLVEMQGAAPRSGVDEISGWLVLPPHGHANASRQFVYVNGQPVLAAPLTKMVDALFVQLYKAHARLAFEREVGGELLSTKRLGNRHAQFLLQLRCRGPAACGVDAEGEVQFADWDGVLAAVKLAVLRAWRPALSLALLKVLDELEQGSSSMAHAQAAQPEAAAAAEGAASFQEWAAQQADDPPLMALLQNRGHPPGTGQVSTNRAAAVNRSGGSNRDSRSGSRAVRVPPLAGIRNSISSRLVRYIEAESPVNSPVGASLATAQPSEPPQAQGYIAAGSTAQQQAPKRAKAGGSTSNLAGIRRSMGPAAAVPSRQRLTFCQEGDDVDALLGSWRPLNPSELQAITSTAAVAAAAAVTAGAALEPHKPPAQQHLPRPAPGQGSQPSQADLALSEQRLLAGTARNAPSCSGPRPRSAPPHAKQRSRAMHTNPAKSLRVQGPPVPPAAAAGAGAQPGMRGMDTVSGLGSNGDAGSISWRQLKAAAAQTKAHLISADATRRTGWGLAEKAAGSGGPSLQVPPEWPGSDQTAAAQHRAANPSVPAAGPSGVALPSFLQPDAAGGLEELLSSWRSPALVPQGSASSETVLQLEAVEAGVFALLKPAGLTREQLHAGRALAQVDSKFIPIACGSILALVDQHAADERVQLELLRHQLVGTGSRPRLRQSLALNPPQPLQLTLAETQLLEMYSDKVRAWGWDWGQLGGGGSREIRLTHVPLVFGTALGWTDMKLFLHHLQDTCGAGGLPAGVVRALNSKACRSAIMFGDELVLAECQAVIDSLKTTQLFNSCAHGRPTTAPLVDLQMLRHALMLRASSRTLGSQGRGSPGATAGLASRLRHHISTC